MFLSFRAASLTFKHRNHHVGNAQRLVLSARDIQIPNEIQECTLYCYCTYFNAPIEILD